MLRIQSTFALQVVLTLLNGTPGMTRTALNRIALSIVSLMTVTVPTVAEFGNTAQTEADLQRRSTSFRAIGCDPTGRTDCTSLAQAALDAMSSGGGGILFGDPRDFYLIDADLYVRDNEAIDLGVAVAREGGNGVWGLNTANTFGLGPGPGGTILLSPAATIHLGQSAGIFNGYVINSQLTTPVSKADALRKIAGFAGTAISADRGVDKLQNLAVVGFNKVLSALTVDGRITVRDLNWDATNGLDIENSLDVDHLERVSANALYTAGLQQHFRDGTGPALTYRSGYGLKCANTVDGLYVYNFFTYGFQNSIIASSCETLTMIGGGADNDSANVSNNGGIIGLQASGTMDLQVTDVQINQTKRGVVLTNTGTSTLIGLVVGANGNMDYHFVAGPGSHGQCIGCSFTGGVPYTPVWVQQGAGPWNFASTSFNAASVNGPWRIDASALPTFAATGTQINGRMGPDVYSNVSSGPATDIVSGMDGSSPAKFAATHSIVNTVRSGNQRSCVAFGTVNTVTGAGGTANAIPAGQAWACGWVNGTRGFEWMLPDRNGNPQTVASLVPLTSSSYDFGPPSSGFTPDLGSNAAPWRDGYYSGQVRAGQTGGGSSSAVLASSAGNPSVGWQAEGNSADTRVWDSIVLGSTLNFRAVNDANSAASTWLKVSRSGYAVAGVAVPVPLSGPVNTLDDGAGNMAVEGHVSITGVAPTVSACGISPAIIGSDRAGMVTTGLRASRCTITFNVAYAKRPICTVTGESATVTYAVSPTALTITAGAAVNIDYECFAQSGG